MSSRWCHSSQEPLFRNAPLARQLPLEARRSLAEFLVEENQAMWADESKKERFSQGMKVFACVRIDF